MKTQAIDQITRPALRYQGSKFRLAQWIIANMPPHKIYVEPFGGSAAVLLQKKPINTEVYNDINGDIVNVFRVLQDKEKAEELQRLLYLTPYSRAVFYSAYEKCENDSDISRAQKTIIRAFMGVASSSSVRGRNGFSLALNSGDDRIPNFDGWKNHYKQIMLFSERMRNVIIENRDWRWIIDYFDSPDTLFYCDPPYVPAIWDTKGAYVQIMDNDEHSELLETLKKIKGMAIISGYGNSLYETSLQGWVQKTKIDRNQKSKPRQECIWLSPRVSRLLATRNSLFSL